MLLNQSENSTDGQGVSTLPAEQRDAILGRIAQVRAMLGGTDTLTHFQKWKSPTEP